jgi:hypothetical protein
MKVRKLMITAAFMLAIAGAVLAKSKKEPMSYKVDCDDTCYHDVLPVPTGCSTTGTNICSVGLTTYYQDGGCVCAYRRP